MVRYGIISAKDACTGREERKLSMTENAAEKAYQLGKKYEQIYTGCSQCVIAAIQDTLGLRNDAIFKIVEINYWHNRFYDLWKRNQSIRMIDYHALTTEVDYCKSILKRFGIRDVEVKKSDLDCKVNTNHVLTYHNWDDLPPHVLGFIDSLNWVDYRL